MALPESIKTNEDILNAFKVVIPYINHGKLQVQIEHRYNQETLSIA